MNYDQKPRDTAGRASTQEPPAGLDRQHTAGGDCGRLHAEFGCRTSRSKQRTGKGLE